MAREIYIIDNNTKYRVKRILNKIDIPYKYILKSKINITTKYIFSLF